MTRALVISPIYPGPDQPHAGRFVHQQVLSLIRQGIDCRVLTYRPAPPSFPKRLISRTWMRYYLKRLTWPARLDGVEVSQVFYKRKWVTDEDVVPAIGEALIQFLEAHRDYQRFDVVYAHWLWTGGAVALKVRERFGWPLVAIARGSEMHDWQEVHPHCRSYVERVIVGADRVLANCEDLRERVGTLRAGAASGVDVVYNGCDSELFGPASNKSDAKEAVRFDPRRRWLVFCGDVRKVKGISELTEAWRYFSAEHPEWQLVLVGRVVEPSLAAGLKAVGKNRVRFVGQVSQRRVLAFLQAADAYIQPSRLEGLANATMEAMAVGLPVITTDTCGQRELIQNDKNGWLVPAGDAGALLVALEAMAGDRERAQRMGEQARRTIEEQFNPRTEGKRLAGILEQAAKGCGTPAVAAVGNRQISSVR